MKKFKCVLVGLALLLLGITLFILIVPTVKTTDLGLREYFWAIVIIFSAGMGFGLFMAALLDGEEYR